MFLNRVTKIRFIKWKKTSRINNITVGASIKVFDVFTIIFTRLFFMFQAIMEMLLTLLKNQTTTLVGDRLLTNANKYFDLQVTVECSPLTSPGPNSQTN